MTATIKLLSVLISFAMMLTGTYGVEAPEPAARTLTISDVTLTVNDESVTMNPSLSLGAATEAGKALYDLAVNLDGKQLFPTQIAVTEAALTALAKNADVAVTVPAEVINTLVDSASSQAVVTGDAASKEMLKVLTDELIPSYTKVLKKIMDPAFQKEMSARSEALLEQVVDRGEGEPDVVEIDDSAYDVTTYEYTLTTEQLAELIDQVYTLDEDMNALYESLFKFYDKLPEESGLNGMHSFADLYEATGMEMSANIIERRSDDGDVQVNDGQIVIDMAGMVAKAAANADGEADAEDDQAVGVVGGADGASDALATGDAANLQPIVVDVHSTKVGDNMSSRITTEYSIENVALAMEGNSTREAGLMTLDLSMSLEAGDQGGLKYDLSGTATDTYRQFDADISFANEDEQGFSMSCAFNGAAGADTADWNYSLSTEMELNAEDNSGNCGLTLEGVKHGDGTGHAEFAVTGDFAGIRAGLSFDADVTADAIADTATGHEGLVIDDMNKVGDMMQDEVNQGKLMQIAGSYTADAGALMQDESVTALVGLFQKLVSGELIADSAPVVEDKDADGETEDDDGEIEPDIEYSDSLETDSGELESEPADDGVLPFPEPTFGFLPEGMSVVESEVDTAYDTVNVTVTDATYENTMIAIFSAQRQQNLASYTMDAEGNLVQSAANNVQITQADPGSWIATVTRDGVTAELYIDSQTIDAETIAKIISGISF